LSCALCQTRKEKRFCPALHDRICAKCCGEHREAFLDCSSACPYLKQAREYDRFRPELREDERWFADVEVKDDFLDTHGVLLDNLLDSIADSTDVQPTIRDRDVIDALTSLARSFQTRANSGLHYEPERLSLAQQALIEELQEVLRDYDRDGRRMGYRNLRDGETLKAMVFILRVALGRSSGRTLARGFLEFLRSEFVEDGGKANSRIVVP
jgi:hypothetical protein